MTLLPWVGGSLRFFFVPPFLLAGRGPFSVSCGTPSFLAERNEEKIQHKATKAELQRRRQQVRDEKKRRDDMERDRLRQEIEQKGQMSALLSAQRQRDIEAKSEERRLQQKSRMENAARVRRIAANEKLKAQRKMEAAYARMEHMNEVRAAIEQARREQKKLEIIEADRWKLETTLERSITPGPGEYNIDATPKGPKGGTWGKHKPKSDVEWKIYRAAQIPGPGQYKLPSSVLVPGGTWGKHKPKSDVEWQMYRAAQIPGPGEYQPRALKSGVAVKFGNHNPPSDLDRAIRKARDLPVRCVCVLLCPACVGACVGAWRMQSLQLLLVHGWGGVGKYSLGCY